MKYRAGNTGRVFVVQFDDGDSILDNLISIAKTEVIKAGIFYLIGGMKNARVVVGPQKDKIPPVPVWRILDESHEMLGIGTIFWQGDEPKIHFHGAYGKKDSARVGCLREMAETFIILEGIILEVEGIDARRELDPASGLNLLSL